MQKKLFVLAVAVLFCVACGTGVQMQVRYNQSNDSVQWLCYGHYNKATGAHVESFFDEKQGHCICENERYEPLVLASTMSADRQNAHKYYVRSYCVPKQNRNLQLMVFDRVIAMESALAQVENSNKEFAMRSKTFRKHFAHFGGYKVLLTSDDYSFDQLPQGCHDSKEVAVGSEIIRHQTFALNAKQRREFGMEKHKVDLVCHDLQRSIGLMLTQQIKNENNQFGGCICGDVNAKPVMIAGAATVPTESLTTELKFDAYVSPYDTRYLDLNKEQLRAMRLALQDELTNKLHSSQTNYQIHVFCFNEDVNLNLAMRLAAINQERAVKSFGLANAGWGNRTDDFRNRLLRNRSRTVASVADLPQIKQPSGCMNRQERSDWALMISADDPMLTAARYFLSEI